MLLYIRLLNKPWQMPDSPEVPHKLTSKKPEVESEKTERTNFGRTQITSAIRNVQQVYYLERRWFS